MAILQNYTPSTNKRQVAIAPDGGIREVVKVYRTGNPRNISTYQHIEKGDIVISGGDDGAVFTKVTKVDRNNIHVIKGVTDATILNSKQINCMLAGEYAKTYEWVVNGETPHLPKWCGWDGVYTTQEYSKFNALVRLLFRNIDVNNINNPILNGLVFTAMVSPYAGVPTNWDLASPIPRDPLAYPPLPATQYYAVIKFYADGQCEVCTISDESIKGVVTIDISSTTIRSALVAVVYKTPYGDNVRWKLFR